jgi:hypothetical protein
VLSVRASTPVVMSVMGHQKAIEDDDPFFLVEF